MTLPNIPSLEPATVAFLKIAEATGVATLLVGACARDLFLPTESSFPTLRRTLDIDFGVLVDSWPSYHRLRDAVLAHPDFSAALGTARLHGFLYRNEVEIDLIPFGEIVPSDGTLPCWPETFHKQMNLLGYEEAFATAHQREIGGVQVRTLTPEAFVVLKLFAWEDRPQRTKDAQDIAFVLKEYTRLPGRQELLWEPENLDLLERIPDYERQAVHLLGRRIAQDFRPSTRERLRLLLQRESEGNSLRLARQMHRHFDLDSAIRALSDLGDSLRSLPVDFD